MVTDLSHHRTARDNNHFCFPHEKSAAPELPNNICDKWYVMRALFHR